MLPLRRPSRRPTDTVAPRWSGVKRHTVQATVRYQRPQPLAYSSIFIRFGASRLGELTPIGNRVAWDADDGRPCDRPRADQNLAARRDDSLAEPMRRTGGSLWARRQGRRSANAKSSSTS